VEKGLRKLCKLYTISHTHAHTYTRTHTHAHTHAHAHTHTHTHTHTRTRTHTHTNTHTHTHSHTAKVCTYPECPTLQEWQVPSKRPAEMVERLPTPSHALDPAACSSNTRVCVCVCVCVCVTQHGLSYIL